MSLFKSDAVGSHPVTVPMLMGGVDIDDTGCATRARSGKVSVARAVMIKMGGKYDTIYHHGQ